MGCGLWAGVPGDLVSKTLHTRFASESRVTQIKQIARILASKREG